MTERFRIGSRKVVSDTRDGRRALGRAVLAHLLGVSEMTIRRKGVVVGTDEATGAALYDVEQVERAIAEVRPRPARRAAPEPVLRLD